MLVWLSGKIAYTGENQHREHAGKCHHNSLHAEIHAILRYLRIRYKTTNLRSKYDLSGTTIYVARLPTGNARNYFGNSKPCSNCQIYLSKFGIRKVKYTDIIDNIPVLCELRLNKN